MLCYYGIYRGLKIVHKTIFDNKIDDNGVLSFVITLFSPSQASTKKAYLEEYDKDPDLSAQNRY